METRTQVTDVTARLLSPDTSGKEVVRPTVRRPTVRPTATTRIVTEPPPRTMFVRPMPSTGCECDTHIDDPVRTHLQDLINDHSHHLCVCSPNRSDMLRAEAEMKAHPGYADYKARRDAAMKGTRGARQ